MTRAQFVMTPEQSCREAFVEASSFEKSGVYEPQNNARLLLEHVLGVYGAAYYMMQPEPFPSELRSRWEDAVTRKAAGEPAQYIIGSQEFYGLPFEVTPAVLIPRPETELLVEAAARSRPRVSGGAPLAVDIGTGSGAIAVTIASQRPRWQVGAGDISAAALQVAARNAAANGCRSTSVKAICWPVRRGSGGHSGVQPAIYPGGGNRRAAA